MLVLVLGDANSKERKIVPFQNSIDCTLDVIDWLLVTSLILYRHPFGGRREGNLAQAREVMAKVINACLGGSHQQCGFGGLSEHPVQNMVAPEHE
jgi:hypothetical protein